MILVENELGRYDFIGYWISLNSQKIANTCVNNYVHTNGGLSINLLQLFISVGELSSSELGDLDGILF